MNNLQDFKLWGTGVNSEPSFQMEPSSSMQQKVASKLQESARTVERSMQKQQQQQPVEKALRTAQPAEQQTEAVPTQLQHEPAKLQDKLHSEIDKIKQWKLSLDQQMRSKQQALDEKERQLERYRTDIRNLQLRLETTAMKLEEEIEQRTEANRRIDNTRNICEAMKSQVIRTNAIAEKYAKVNKDVDAIHKKNTGELSDIKTKYNDLFEKANRTFASFQKTVEFLKTEKADLELQAAKDKNDFETHVSDLGKVIEDYNCKMNDLSSNIQNCESEITQLKQNKLSLESKLSELKINLETVSKERENLKYCLNHEQTKLNDCAESLKTTKPVFNSTFQESQDILNAFKDISIAQNDLKDHIVFKFLQIIKCINQVLEKSKTFSDQSFGIYKAKITKHEEIESKLHVKIHQCETVIAEKNLELKSSHENISLRSIAMKEISNDLNENSRSFQQMLSFMKMRNDEIQKDSVECCEKLKTNITSNIDKIKNIEAFFTKFKTKFKSISLENTNNKESYANANSKNTNLQTNFDELSKKHELEKKKYEENLKILNDLKKKFVPESFENECGEQKFEEICSCFDKYFAKIQSDLIELKQQVDDAKNKNAELSGQLETSEASALKQAADQEAADRAVDDYKKMATLNADKQATQITQLQATVAQLKAQLETRDQMLASQRRTATSAALQSPNVALGSISRRNSPTRTTQTPASPAHQALVRKRKATPATPRPPTAKRVVPPPSQDAPASIRTLPAKTKKKNNWFDSDSVFGFDE